MSVEIVSQICGCLSEYCHFVLRPLFLTRDACAVDLFRNMKKSDDCFYELLTSYDQRSHSLRLRGPGYFLTCNFICNRF